MSSNKETRFPFDSSPTRDIYLPLFNTDNDNTPDPDLSTLINSLVSNNLTRMISPSQQQQQQQQPPQQHEQNQIQSCLQSRQDSIPKLPIFQLNQQPQQQQQQQQQSQQDILMFQKLNSPANLVSFASFTPTHLQYQQHIQQFQASNSANGGSQQQQQQQQQQIFNDNITSNLDTPLADKSTMMDYWFDTPYINGLYNSNQELINTTNSNSINGKGNNSESILSNFDINLQTPINNKIISKIFRTPNNNDFSSKFVIGTNTIKKLTQQSNLQIKSKNLDQELLQVKTSSPTIKSTFKIKNKDHISNDVNDGLDADDKIKPKVRNSRTQKPQYKTPLKQSISTKTSDSSASTIVMSSAGKPDIKDSIIKLNIETSPTPITKSCLIKVPCQLIKSKSNLEPAMGIFDNKNIKQKTLKKSRTQPSITNSKQSDVKFFTNNSSNNNINNSNIDDSNKLSSKSPYSIMHVSNGFNSKKRGRSNNNNPGEIHFIMADPDQLRGNKRQRKLNKSINSNKKLQPLKNSTNIVNNRSPIKKTTLPTSKYKNINNINNLKDSNNVFNIKHDIKSDSHWKINENNLINSEFDDLLELDKN